MPADLLIRIRADDQEGIATLKRLAQNVEQVGESAKKPQGPIAGLMGAFKDIGLAGLGVKTAVESITGAVSGFLGPAIDAQQVTAQLQSVLTSTGGKAGVTQDAVEELSGALSKVTTFEDEAITSGQSLLLTFTNIGSDVFPQATETMLNMSQALGQDLKSSAVQLGKALNDPINGMTALSRVGVSFTDEQKEQIKVLQESGDIVGAQTIILKELETEFGGAARAAGQTFGGQLKILQNEFGNLLETIGGPVLTVLQRLLQAILPLVQQFGVWLPAAIDKAMRVAEDFGQQIEGVTAVVSVLVEAFTRDVLPTLLHFAQLIQENAQPILAALAVVLTTVVIPAFVAWAAAAAASATATIVALAPVLVPLAAIGAAVFVLKKAWDENWGDIQGKTAAVWDFLSRNIFTPVAETFANLTAELLPELQQTWAVVWAGIQDVTAAAAAAVQTALAGLARWWSEHFDTISAVASLAMDSVRTVIVTTLDVLKDVILVFLRLLRGDWAGAWEAAKMAVADAWEGIKHLTNNAIEILKTAFANAGPALMDLLRQGFQRKIGEVRATVTEAMAGIAALLPHSYADEGPLSQPTDWTTVVLGEGTSSLPSRLDFARSIVKTAAQDIGQTWDVLADGMADSTGAIAEAVGEAVDDVEEQLRRLAEQLGREMARANSAAAAAAAGITVPGGATGAMPAGLPSDAAMVSGFPGLFYSPSTGFVYGEGGSIVGQTSPQNLLDWIRREFGGDVAGSGRQFGGPVRAGHPYVVGERGPELFVPGTSGSILPNGAAPVVNVYVSGSVVTERELADKTLSYLRRQVSNVGTWDRVLTGIGGPS